MSGLAHGQILQNQARLYAADGSDQVVQIETTVHDSSVVASYISSTPDKLGQTTTFQSTSSGSNQSYEWDFWDTSPPVTTSTAIVTHTYTATGTYNVTLTASNSAGSSSVTDLVEIISVVIAPVASFTSSPDELGQATVFINTSQDGGDDPENITYQWTFGDGASSTNQHPTHTYNAPGAYVVSLTISNSVGSNAFSDRVTINPGSEGQDPTQLYLPLIFKNSAP
jgi:PKD repeat protein